MNILKGICAATLLASVLVSQPVYADSWALPTPQTYQSTDKTMRFRVIPSKLASQLEYFEEKAAEDEGAEPTDRPPARGILERRNALRAWEVVWEKPLVNEVAPVRALISPSGKYVVTFDDWHAVGTSKNTVVVYAADGHLIKVLALRDMVPDFYVEALPRSVSSIDWSEGADFSTDGEELIIQLNVPNEEAISSVRAYVDLRIRLGDGTVVENTNAAWTDAQDKARAVAASKAEAEKRWLKAFKAPLLAPDPASEPGWHGYLREAFNRIDKDWPERSPSTNVLRSPGADNYAPSEGWLRQALLQEDYPRDVIMIATLSSPEHLLTRLEAIMGKAAKGLLKEVRVYVALPATYTDRLTEIFKASGAELIVLDPTKPIPQRPDRLRDMEE